MNLLSQRKRKLETSSMNCFAFVFRRNVNLNQTQYSPGNMQAGNIKKVPMYDNKGFGKLCYKHYSFLRHPTYEPRSEKTNLRGFRPGPTQTGLYSYRRWLEA